MAQLVEHDLAKVGAAGSSPVSRSRDLVNTKSLFNFKTDIIKIIVYVLIGVKYMVTSGYPIYIKEGDASDFDSTPIKEITIKNKDSLLRIFFSKEFFFYNYM